MPDVPPAAPHDGAAAEGGAKNQGGTDMETVQIQLDAETARLIDELAAALGVTADDYLADSLRELRARQSRPRSFP